MERLNYKSPLLTEDFAFISDVMETEILERTKIMFASYIASGGEPGMVSETNPVGTTDENAPFYVKSSQEFKITTNGGYAVTKKGELIIADQIINEDMADPTLNVVNLVIAEYREKGEDQRPSTYDNTLVPSKNVRDVALQIITLADYNNPTTFTTERKENVVVCAAAYAYYDQTSGSYKMNIDMTRNTYDFIRPWFSIVDNTHRNKLGTGIVTENNPHGYAFRDLTAANMTIYQQFLSYGTILSKDVCIPTLAGLDTTESFSTAAIKQDDGAGTVTGSANAYYLITQHYPIQLGAVYERDIPQNQYHAMIVPFTNIIKLGRYEVPANLDVTYMYSPALEPPGSITSNNLILAQPNPSSELAISEGVDFSEIASPSINFEGSGPIPKRFDVFLDGLGVLIRNPNIILPATRLNSLTTAYQFQSTLYKEAYIVVGLTLASVGLTLKVLITGKDENGAVLQETVEFDSTWEDSSIPTPVEKLTQFQRTTNKFYAVTSFEIVERSNDGNDSTIIIYADAADALYQALPVLDVFWDGHAVSSVKKVTNVRPVLVPETSKIYINVEDPVFAAWFANTYLGTGHLNGSNAQALFSEDFNVPQWRDLSKVDGITRRPSGTIAIDVDNMNNGDSVTIAPAKVITARSNVPINSVSRERYANVVKIVTATDHYLTTGYNVDLSSMGGVGYNSVDNTVTVIDNITFTFSNTGDDEGKHSTYSRKRTSNVAQIQLASAHGLVNGDEVVIAGMTNSDYDGTVIATVVDTTTFEYNNVGADEGTVSTATRERSSNVARLTTAIPHQLQSGQILDVSSMGDGSYNASGVSVTVIDPTTFEYTNIGTDELTQADVGGIVDNYEVLDSAGIVTYLVEDLSGIIENRVNSAFGEFHFDPTDDDITRDNMILTIQDVDFNSQVQAANEDGVLKLTGNFGPTDECFLLSTTTTVPGAIVVFGYKNGFKESVALDLPRFGKLLDSQQFGANWELMANKYRTRAIDVERSDITKLMVACHRVEKPVTLYCKPTYQARPDVYQPHVLATSTTVNNVFVLNFSQPVAKFYLEIFGKLEGVSVYIVE